MPVYAYNSTGVQSLLDAIDEEIRKVEDEKSVIVEKVGSIKTNWRDDDTRLGQRNKDLETLLTNADNIVKNMQTIRNVIANQRTQYEKLNY